MYRPGHLTTKLKNGMLLSQGLTARRIAQKQRPVPYDVGDTASSNITFHEMPDFGATFPDTRPSNKGGWVYVSNSEMAENGAGGVGAITFDKAGNVINYEMVLTGTTMNCGGGRTPWDTWVSCEEVMATGAPQGSGQIYQVDPFGSIKSEKMTMGLDGGRFESFTYDIRNLETPHFFASEDRRRGAVRRFTPSNPDWTNNPWKMLHGDGALDFLYMDQISESGGTFRWLKSKREAQLNAARMYPECEGIEVVNGRMYLVAKRIKILFILDLDSMTYTRHSTSHGAFDGSPDQVARVLREDQQHARAEILYFTEEGGKDSGVHGRNSMGQYFSILEGGPNLPEETTGLSFSPNGKHLYVAFQARGVLYDVTRLDGLPFHGKTLNIKYHNTEADILPSED